MKLTPDQLSAIAKRRAETKAEDGTPFAAALADVDALLEHAASIEKDLDVERYVTVKLTEARDQVVAERDAAREQRDNLQAGLDGATVRINELAAKAEHQVAHEAALARRADAERQARNDPAVPGTVTRRPALQAAPVDRVEVADAHELDDEIAVAKEEKP